MIAGRHIVAMVPMRHVSERVPFKNFRPLGGIPLYRHIVQSLLRCPYIDSIAINTDSPAIADDIDAWASSERVVIMPRPSHLLGGDVPMTDILQYDLTRIQGDFYVQTHSTNPFLTTQTISSAIELFMDSLDRFDSLFTVTPLRVRLWDADGTAINHNPAVLLRTQDLPPVLEENSNLYIFDRETLERTGRRIGIRPLMYIVQREESWDIDEELDFTMAECLYDRRSV